MNEESKDSALPPDDVTISLHIVVPPFSTRSDVVCVVCVVCVRWCVRASEHEGMIDRQLPSSGQIDRQSD